MVTAELPLMLAPAGRCANKAPRSTSTGPDQAEIVAPAIRWGRVSRMLIEGACRSVLGSLVLLIFRMRTPCRCWQRRDANASRLSNAAGMNERLMPRVSDATYGSGTLMLNPGVWIGLRSSLVW
jgi:hypothetical protein